jgi:hypothetical protein
MTLQRRVSCPEAIERDRPHFCRERITRRRYRSCGPGNYYLRAPDPKLPGHSNRNYHQLPSIRPRSMSYFKATVFARSQVLAEGDFMKSAPSASPQVSNHHIAVTGDPRPYQPVQPTQVPDGGAGWTFVLVAVVAIAWAATRRTRDTSPSKISASPAKKTTSAQAIAA